MSVTNIRVRTTSARPKPASASARLDDPEDRPCLGGDVARVASTGRRARRRSCRRPSSRRRPTIARLYPATASHGPPDEIRRRSLTTRRRLRPVRSARQARTSGSAAMASSRPASSVVRGTIESTSRYSVGAWSLPPIGPRPSRLGTPMPDGRVGVRRAAGRRVGDLEAERARHGLGVLDEPAAPVELLHRPPARHLGSSSTVVSGTSVASAIRRISASAVSSASRSVARTSTSSEQRSATTLGRVPPAITPTLTVTPGQRPLSACRSSTIRRRLEDRAAALLGLDAGVGGPAVDGHPQVDDALAGRHDVAVRPGALEHERDVAVGGELADVRRRGRRADLLVRVGDEHEPLERQAAALGDDRLERVQPGEQARTSCR